MKKIDHITEQDISNAKAGSGVIDTVAQFACYKASLSPQGMVMLWYTNDKERPDELFILDDRECCIITCKDNLFSTSCVIVTIYRELDVIVQ